MKITLNSMKITLPVAWVQGQNSFQNTEAGQGCDFLQTSWEQFLDLVWYIGWNEFPLTEVWSSDRSIVTEILIQPKWMQVYWIDSNLTLHLGYNPHLC